MICLNLKRHYLDFPASLAFSFLNISLPVSLSFHGAGNAWDNTAALWRGQSLLLHLQCFAFPCPLFNRHGGILLFFCLQVLGTRSEDYPGGKTSTLTTLNVTRGLDQCMSTHESSTYIYKTMSQESIPPVPRRKQQGLPSTGPLASSSSGCSALSAIEHQLGQRR